MLKAPKLHTAAVIVLMISVMGIAGGALRHILDGMDWNDVRVAIRRISPVRLAASLGFTVASYVVLTGYDVVSLRMIGRKLPYATAALASFTSYIFSHNFGFAVLTAGTARLRIYRPRGLTLAEVGQIMAITGVTYWLGVLLLLGIGLITIPNALSLRDWALLPSYQTGAGIVILGVLALYLLILWRLAGRSVRLFGWQLTLPSWRAALVQFALGVVDLMLATAALFVLVPGLSITVFPWVVMSYLIASISGLLAHAPGGVGVFEAVMLLSLPLVDRTTLFAALLGFRVIYYLLPLAAGILLFVGHEAMRVRAQSQGS